MPAISPPGSVREPAVTPEPSERLRGVQRQATQKLEALMAGSKQDVRERILNEVVKMNPGLAPGSSAIQLGRTVQHEVAQAQRGTPAGGPQSARFRKVFRSMLQSYAAEYEERQRGLDVQRDRLRQEHHERNHRYVQQLIDFFVASGETEFRDSVRAVMRRHKAFLQQIGIHLAELGQKIRDVGQEGRGDELGAISVTDLRRRSGSENDPCSVVWAIRFGLRAGRDRLPDPDPMVRY